MERSLDKKEEEVVGESSCVNYHPCHFLEKAFRALFKFFGVEIGAKRDNYETNKQEKTSLLKPPSDAITPDNYASKNTKKSSEEVPNTTGEEAADPPPSTTQSINQSASSLLRRGRSGLTPPPPPQHN